jgi:hypothetical protein
MQALDELGLGELMDVLLERKVDERARVRDERTLLDHVHALAFHAGAEPRFYLRMLEMEEMARVVPDEPVLVDRLAVTADLRVRFENEVVPTLERGGCREPADAGTDDERLRGLHAQRGPSKRQPAEHVALPRGPSSHVSP